MLKSEDETKLSRRLLRNGGGDEKPEPRRKGHVPWKLIAVVMVAFGVFAAVMVLRPWEVESGGGEPTDEEEQTLASFIHRTTLVLQDTEDGLGIDNVEIYAPLPQEFENLHLSAYRFVTKDNHYIIFQEGSTWENLAGREAPTFTIEDTLVGKRVVIRVTKFYLGEMPFPEFIWVEWSFAAPENTSPYDTPSDNKNNIYVNYVPQKTIDLKLETFLAGGENWGSWLGTYFITGYGWFNIPPDNVMLLT